MMVSNYKIPTHFNCVGCKRRCLTDEDYKNNMSMYDEKLDWTCLVKDNEIDLSLDRPNCYEKIDQ